MAVGTAHVLYGMLLPSGTLLAQLTQHTTSANIEDLIGFAAGHPQPLFTGSRMAKPDVSFDSPDLASVLTETGLAGASQAAGTGVDVFAKKITDLGVREADASLVHQRFRVAQSFLYPTSIQASQTGDASISARLAITYDGANAPLVAAGSLALAGTVPALSFFGLGPVKINGAFLLSVTDVRLDLNPQLIEVASDGDPYNTFVAVGQIQPVLSVTTLEAPTWVSLTPDGSNVTALKFWFRRRHPTDGLNHADGAAQHVSLTGTGGRVHIEQTTGGSDSNEPLSTTLRIPIKAPNVAGTTLTIATTDTIA